MRSCEAVTVDSEMAKLISDCMSGAISADWYSVADLKSIVQGSEAGEAGVAL